MNLYEIIGSLLIAILISALAALSAGAFVSVKAYSKELEVLSYRDALTNINNNRSYQEHMEELSKKKLPYGLIFMDLNDFKQVNDTYGHEAGDTLLNIVAKRLQNSIREKDKAFRIGGDEFVVVIHGTHDAQFYDGVIERMRQNVARDVTLNNGVILKVSISAGFARCPEDGSKFEDVVKIADDAMYHNKRLFKAQKAKQAGREAGDVPSGTGR
jgi:diguanylate cyclase (GGDEF)-like protein